MSEEKFFERNNINQRQKPSKSINQENQDSSGNQKNVIQGHIPHMENRQT